MALLGHLTPLHGGDAIPLTGSVLTVGRAGRCDVIIRHRSISSNHCRLTYLGGTWVVEDLGSKNGTFAGRTPCEKTRLKSGAVLRIGGIRFELTAAPPSSVSPVASEDEELAMELLDGSPVSSPSTKKEAGRRTPGTTTDRDGAGRSETEPQPSFRQNTKPANTVKEHRRAAPGTAEKSPASTAKSARPVKRFLGKLTPQAGGDPIALMDEKIVIGRGRGCGIRLKYSTVSTEHCRLTFHEGHWSVCDLGSRNGIRINSQPASEDWLMPGDILALGKLRFEIDYQPKSDEPPPAFDVTGDKSLLEKSGLEKALKSDANPSWLVTDQDPEPEQRIDLESL